MATTITKTELLVGKKIRRREDPRLITGTATYLDDIKVPGMHHAVIVRSPHAAAKIKGIDTKAAAALPGVVAIFTGADVEQLGAVPCAASLPGLRVPHHHLLAQDRVYYVGHPVAVVVATDRYIARDAADAVEVDYDVLPAVADPEKALAPGAPPVHPEWPDNVAFTFHQDGGDVEQAFRDAEVVVKQRITSQRLIPTAMETRGVVAEWRPGERAMTMYSSTQIPHLMRTMVAGILGMPENLLRVITPEVGGGFGSKLNVYAEEALMCFIAKQIGKPVKWVESRRENFTCTIHGRGHVDYFELAAKRDGTMLGLKLKLIQDLGSYHQLLTPAIPDAFRPDDAGSLPLQEHLRGHRRRLHELRADRCLSRRGTAGGDSRHRAHGRHPRGRIENGPGRDPAAELRRQRRISLPHRYRSDLRQRQLCGAAERALELVDYPQLRKQQTKARAAGKLMGIGISTYGEICAMGPSVALPAGGWESATVKIEPTGKVTVLTGASPHGQGEETTFAQIAADELGCDIDDVLVIHGDTAIVQYGIGTFGSRGTAVGGAALFYALQDLKAKMKKFGAMLLESHDGNT